MYRIGIDLGGTNIAAGIVNEQYEIVYQASVPTGSERDSDAIMEDMAALCHKLCAESGISIEEIASRVGFRNQRYFITTFKRLEGVSPGKYHDRQLGQRVYTYDPPEFIDPKD